MHDMGMDMGESIQHPPTHFAIPNYVEALRKPKLKATAGRSNERAARPKFLDCDLLDYPNSNIK